MFLVANVAGGMKDSEPTLLGSPDLPDISLSSGCQDHHIYGVSMKNQGRNGKLHLPYLTSILCSKICHFGNESKCSLFELDSQCHSCPPSHLGQTPCSNCMGWKCHPESSCKKPRVVHSFKACPHLHCQISSKCRYFISWGQGITASRVFQWSILVQKMPTSTYVSVDREDKCVWFKFWEPCNSC